MVPTSSTSSKPENIPLTPSQLTPVLPLHDGPLSNWPPPPLPPLNISSETSKHWSVTRHVFAAAYPRSRAGCYVDDGSKGAEVVEAGSAKASREEIAAKVEAMKKKQYEAPLQGEVGSGHLWIAANCYRRKGNASQASAAGQSRPATTMVLVHATGLHKETWEPALNRLAKKSNSRSTVVDEIWSLDIVNQGDSAILNIDHLGPTFDWMDVARDIANFFIRYLPQYSPQNIPNPYPTQLLCLDVPSIDLPRLQGSSKGQKYVGPAWRGRHIISVGHSIGAASSVSACSFLPEGIIKGLVLFDPTVQPLHLGSDEKVMPLVHGAVMRRDVWSTKDEALDGFAKKKAFFGRWNSEALVLYAEDGLYTRKDGKVTLKARGKDEAVTFLDPNLRGARACWNRLKYLPASLRVHIILADPAESVIQSRGITPENLLNEIANTAPSYQQLYGIHHMIVQEAPDIAATALAGCVNAWLPTASAKL